MFKFDKPQEPYDYQLCFSGRRDVHVLRRAYLESFGRKVDNDPSYELSIFERKLFALDDRSSLFAVNANKLRPIITVFEEFHDQTDTAVEKIMAANLNKTKDIRVESMARRMLYGKRAAEIAVEIETKGVEHVPTSLDDILVQDWNIGFGELLKHRSANLILPPGVGDDA